MWLVLVAGMVAILSSAVSSAPGTQPSDGDPDLVRLRCALESMEELLARQQGMQVSASVNAVVTGPGETVRVSKLHKLAADHLGRFRLELSQDRKPLLRVVSDGVKITRLYVPANCYSEQDGKLESLLDDSLTMTLLQETGLDMIGRKDLSSYFLSHCQDVRYLGEAKFEEAAADHYRVDWDDDADVEIWISSGDQPLLLGAQWRSSTDISGSGTYDTEVRTVLRWELGKDVAAGEFRLAIPEGAARKDDLMQAIVDEE